MIAPMRFDTITISRQGAVAEIRLSRPAQGNPVDAAFLAELDAAASMLHDDDAVSVVMLSGEGGVFSSGADMGNAYTWYETAGDGERRRPSQRRRLAVDRRTFAFCHELMGYPKVVVAEVRGLALGGGFELALMADIAVIARDAEIGMPATRFLGPALGSLHMFFHRLGPVLARRLLLTGDTIRAGTVEHLGIFTEVVDDADVEARAAWWARKAARMPADGIVMAKEAFRLVEQLQAYQGEEVASYLFHAFGTNLQFENGEFNFVKTRAQHGTKRAFELRDEHFDVPEPG